MIFLTDLLPFIKFSLFAKIGFLGIDFLFIIFLLVAIRQVYAMDAIISDVHDSGIIKLGAVLLFIIAVSLFLTALVIL